MNFQRIVISIFFAVLLVGCQSNQAVDQGGLAPEAVANNAGYYKNQGVRWGGTVIRTMNHQNSTQVEVLAYPLDSNDRPLIDRPSTGRFVASVQRFLDPVDYSPGRHVVVNGVIAGTKRGKVGGSSYSYPLVDAGSVSLMQPASTTQNSSWPANLHIGIGFWGGL